MESGMCALYCNVVYYSLLGRNESDRYWFRIPSAERLQFPLGKRWFVDPSGLVSNRMFSRLRKSAFIRTATDDWLAESRIPGDYKSLRRELPWAELHPHSILL